MAVTLQQVLNQLDTDEPNYPALAALGPEAVPHLASLVRGEDAGLASKAAYLASLIQSEDSAEVLAVAAGSSHEVVRVAAASGLRNLSADQALPLAGRLLDDADAGVRKQALRAAGRLGLGTLEAKVKAVASADTDTALRQVAAQELKQMAAVRADRARESPPPAKPKKKKK